MVQESFEINYGKVSEKVPLKFQWNLDSNSLGIFIKSCIQRHLSQ